MELPNKLVVIFKFFCGRGVLVSTGSSGKIYRHNGADKLFLLGELDSGTSLASIKKTPTEAEVIFSLKGYSTFSNFSSPSHSEPVLPKVKINVK